MEEKEEIIYDLESPESGDIMEGGHSEPLSEGQPGGSDTETDGSGTETAESAPEGIQAECPSGEAVKKTSSHKEIERMMEEMGADTLLSIIKDNRNVAIRQIISEVEASRDSSLASGGSVAGVCSSIFDLAALA